METVRQTPHESKDLTVGELFDFLAPSVWREPHFTAWPPDVFALAAAVLQKSGAYIHVVSRWPPSGYGNPPEAWVENIGEIGRNWRGNCISSGLPPPQVESWWRTVLDNSGVSVLAIRKNHALSEALLQLCAAADEACKGAGIAGELEKDPFEKLAKKRLQPHETLGSSLCKNVHPTKVRVLPKLHTPQSGITIRSISHHLALAPSGDVRALWHLVPARSELDGLNLLLLPWPLKVRPGQFHAVDPPVGELLNMPDRFCFFGYDLPKYPQNISQSLNDVLDRADEIVDRIHGVILPELSIAAQQFDEIHQVVLKRNAFLVCGVGEAPPSKDEKAKNYISMGFPISSTRFTPLVQSKHHRWRLDKRQIVQYGLGATLNPMSYWWEHVTVGPRDLNFVTILPWLTMCVLLCEDLARQDPVADLLRAVGPNLVVALLMDGPQLAFRWPARYATVLADDPGSSVLTLTSIGMAELSRPLEKQSKSRIVALWKDARGGDPVQIELPISSDAVILSLAVEYSEEWSADGRSDERRAGYPILTGIHPVSKTT